MLSLTRAIRASVTVQQVVGVVRAKLSGNKAVENTLIVDVRSTGEVAQTGIIPTAINIPLKLLPAALSDEVDDDEFLDVFGVPKPQKGVTQLIFYCAHGVRSATATEVAEDAGYTNAKNFGGSFTDWQNHSNAFRDGACDKVGTAASTAHPGDK
ncbi:Rhodanese like domain [Trypanosoma vivax]|uniref:Rhodanese domain-containing protein n=1 Tax=Trypanosoma vivax (strain Y486) TaxID=1055687 RepID=G0U8N6_TRYVY|nr:hypothetical protein TRVL_06601 [Trypanosoma vivax]KAH8605016.1 Rhodanese like domain [Trypanosoma vivax]CCC53963.1 conserved hypothetical protein [Trypanosoma vivax Y486]